MIIFIILGFMMITSSLQYILLIGGRIVDAIDQMLIFFMTILIYDDDIAITKCVSLNLNSKFFPKKKIMLVLFD